MNNSYWDREDTRLWISILLSRIEDMNYYKSQAHDWCMLNGVTDLATITKCMITTCIWVSHMRKEDLTFGELYDLIGIIDPEAAVAAENEVDYDHIIEFKKGIGDCELEQILELTLNDSSNN